jgi:ABC-2 type transport system ATP-binding protein
MNVIEAHALTKYYGSSRGVVDLTFDVRPGEVFGFLGPNGAGKTTTIRTTLDMIRATSGTVEVFGLDSHADSIEIHARTGFLPGEFTAYQRMSGRRYLGYLSDLRGGNGRSAIEELAERLDLDLTATIRSLSHGNKQKLGLIQAFMHDPELLILDEPTQGLDPLVQQEFQAMVLEARAEGRAVLLSSHVLPEVERVCDRVAIVREGLLVAIEDVGDLKAKAARTLELRFASPPPIEVFADIEEVREVEAHGDVIRCEVVGEMDAVVKAAADLHVVDLQSHEPSLESIFLAFYGPDGRDPDEGGGQR